MVTFITSLLKRYFTKIALHFSFFVNIHKKHSPKRFLLYNLTMNRFFNPDNPVTILLSRIFDCILLNLCFVVACIPIVTAGPALTGLYAVALKMAEGEFGYTFDTFISSFRKNMRQGIQLWLILLSAGIFLSADLYIVLFVLPSKFILLQIPVWLLIFIDISAFIYVFPMLARYEQGNLQLIKNSLLLSLGNIPLTIFIIVITGIIIDLSIHNGSLLVLFFSIFLFIGFALMARLFAIFIRRAFLSIRQ